jgi:hypothetical protein
MKLSITILLYTIIFLYYLHSLFFTFLNHYYILIKRRINNRINNRKTPLSFSTFSSIFFFATTSFLILIVFVILNTGFIDFLSPAKYPKYVLFIYFSSTIKFRFTLIDPVRYFDTVYRHVFSNVAHELDRHQTKLQSFRPNTAISFAHDYRRFSDIYEEIALIQKCPISEPIMQAFLDKHNTHDPRPAISGALSHARNSHWSYEATSHAMFEADERSPTGTNIRYTVYLSHLQPNHSGTTTLVMINL